MLKKTAISAIALLFVFSTSMLTAFARQAETTTAEPGHAVAGDLEKVADDGKTITVKTGEGTEEVFKVGAKTTVKKRDEGSHVVVHYTGEGADKTADAVDVAGKGAWKATEGTVTDVGKGGKEVTVEAADGSKEVFILGKDATVDTGHGVVRGSEYTAKAGDKVVVYSTVKPGKKIVHLFKKL